MPGLQGLYRTASIRRIEASWLEQSPPGTLMARAASAVADQATGMLRRMPPQTFVLLLVGPGNNGGDALLAGRILSGRGFAVRACALGPVLHVPPQAREAAAAWQAWHEAGLSLQAMPEDSGSLSEDPALVIDGLFGIGLSRALPAAVAPVLDWIRRVRAPVLAIDVPSGLDADTGAAVEDGRLLPATITITMIADKPGLHTGQGRIASGQVIVAPLTDAADDIVTEKVGGGQSPLQARGVRADGILLDAAAIRRLLPARALDAHKGTGGDVLVIGGRLGMAGAARLAARGALGAGAGRVFIAGGHGTADAADPGRPEIIRASITPTDPLPARAKVVSIGPGLGQDREAAQYLRAVTASPAVMVCDADALNLLAASPDLTSQVRRRRGATILTPHPLEAARLLMWTTARVQHDRIGAALELARRFKAVVALKGAGTVVADAQGNFAVNGSGNPVLATGGTGDVLAGIIAALAAGPLADSASAAACAGVWLHGAAGDHAARVIGPAGVPAGSIADSLPAVFGLMAEYNHA